MRHLLVGDVELSYDKFLVAGADRQTLTVYRAEPGSSTEQALRLPAGLA
jgi:hypothetical protein